MVDDFDHERHSPGAALWTLEGVCVKRGGNNCIILEIPQGVVYTGSSSTRETPKGVLLPKNSWIECDGKLYSNTIGHVLQIDDCTPMTCSVATKQVDREMSPT